MGIEGGTGIYIGNLHKSLQPKEIGSTVMSVSPVSEPCPKAANSPLKPG